MRADAALINLVPFAPEYRNWSGNAQRRIELAPLRTVQTERIIEAEGGLYEAVTGNVSRTDDIATRVDGRIAAFGRTGVKAREGSLKASIGLSG
jgi:hypothetical protein